MNRQKPNRSKLKDAKLSDAKGFDRETVDTESDDKTNLKARFVITGVIAVLMIVGSMTCRGYYILLSTGVENEAQRAAVRISEAVDMVGSKISNIERRHIASVGQLFKHLNGIESAMIYNTNLDPIWPNERAATLSGQQKEVARELMANKRALERVIDLDFYKLSTWVDGVLGQNEKLPLLVKLNDRSGNTFAVASVSYDFTPAFDYARHFGFRVFIFSTLCASFLFLALYYTFRRGVKTIEQQERKLNKQIDRLSNLLADNRLMQRNMKTASARAVEMNEQFLRRVGADLHDGPAQMIGFSVLRLNQVSKHEVAKQFGPEFHAVREALDESLDEIRGISSGLVLPELEKMSLEECLRKVVTLHGAKSKAEIAQFYQDLPSDIELPIKICAYRFIQEGLNNAHRHGQAKKCRLSAYTKGAELIISLKDNGIGFRKSILTKGGAHLGLVGLKDRVESLGGRLSINSELGVGTALRVNLTLSDDL